MVDYSKYRTIDQLSFFKEIEELFELRRYDEAKQRLRKAESESADPNPSLYSWLGAAHFYSRDFLQAVECLTEGLRLVPNDQRTRILRACSYIMLGDTVSADIDMQQTRAISMKRYRSLWMYWAAANESHSRYEVAIDVYAKLIEARKQDIYPRKRLAFLLASAPGEGIRNGLRATELAQGVCDETSWSDWESISILAAAFAEQGKFDQAVQYALQALALAPKNERDERQARVEQYRNRNPFRLSKES